MNTTFAKLERDETKVCSCCGIDQNWVETMSTYFLISDDDASSFLCPSCFFAKHWQQYAKKLGGYLLYTDTPQSLISMIFYFRCFARNERASSTLEIQSAVNRIFEVINQGSRDMLLELFPESCEAMSSPARFSKICTLSGAPDYVLKKVRYYPSREDFQLMQVGHNIESQLEDFLGATKFSLSMDHNHRSFLTEIVTWYKAARSVINI